MAEATPEQQKAFIERYAPYANLAATELGIPARVILGKLALESGWGTAMGGNNIAGLKPSSSAQAVGSIGSSPRGTFEDLPGGRKNITDKFLNYATPEQGIGGMVNWIRNSGVPGIAGLAGRNSGDLFRAGPTDQAAIDAWNTSGYSTDKKLIKNLPLMVAAMPQDMSQYGIATSFMPGQDGADLRKVRSLTLQNDGSFDVSDYFGNPSNSYKNRDTWASKGAIEYQPTGYLTPRDPTTKGIPLPEDGANSLTPGKPSFGKVLADAISGGVTKAGKALRAEVASLINPSQYKAANPDVEKSGMDAVTHFLRFGQDENRPIDLAGNHFDKNAYLASNPDVAEAGMNPLLHFLQFGQHEGRSAPIVGPDGTTPAYAAPGTTATVKPEFNQDLYYAANPDVLDSGMSALDHFKQFGFKEGRTIDPYGDQIAQTFDQAAYLRANPDVAAAHIDPLEHYLVNGIPEGRTLGPDTTAPTIGPGVAANLINDPSLAQTYAPTGDLASLYGQGPQAATQGPPGATPTQGAGPATGTAGAPALTPTQGPGGLTPTQGPPTAVQAWEQNYYDANPDVRASGMGAMEHYLRFGRPEGRAIDTLGERFSDEAYLAKNPDVARSGLDPFQHYLRSGIPEGRQAELVGPDGTTRGVDNWLDAPTLNNATYAPLIDNYQKAHTYAAPPLTPTQGAPGLTPTIGAPAETPTIGPPGAVKAWDANEYLLENPDVAAAGIDPAYHASRFGQAEGRTAGFDINSIPKFMQGWGGAAGPDYQNWIRSITQPVYGQPGPVGDNQPLGSGISYNNGSVQYGGVDIGPSGLFDPAQSEKSYLNTQADQINAGAQHSAQVAGMLTGYDPHAGYTPMPTFAVNGTQQGNMNAVGNAQAAYSNAINTVLGQLAPVAPAASSFLPRATPSFGFF